MPGSHLIFIFAKIKTPHFAEVYRLFTHHYFNYHPN
jgi:hypothetical protein